MKTFATPARAEPARPRPCPVCGRRDSRPAWRLEGFSFARCPSCGLLRQEPQPEPRAVLERYGEAYFAYELERESAYRDLELLALDDLGLPALEARARRLAARRGASGGMPAFLDVGCATGALLELMRGRGWAVVGVEACAPAAGHAVEARGLEVHAGTLEAAALPEASFEVVHASHLVEHLNDPRAFLAECSRLLVPGGELLLTTPNAAGLQARILRGSWRSAIFDHLYLFSDSTIRWLLEEEGFVVEALVTWGGWAAGQEPAFLKPLLDPLAKRLGLGDVMALRARRKVDLARGGAGRIADGA